MIKYSIIRNIVAMSILLIGNKSLLAQENPNKFEEMVDFMPPPPNATAIIKNGMLSVNKNTGAPNVNIPLYTIKGNKLSTSVSLNYNSTGIQVDEVSGRVGMGWSLNAGGVITRTLRGSPDETSTRITPTLPPALDCNTYTFLDRADRYYDINAAGYDAQPDLFHFNMNGISGSFVISNVSPLSFMAITPEKFSIQATLSSGVLSTFTITTTDGIKYYFGGTGATEKTKKISSCGKDFSQPLANSWYLTKIEHPNGEAINFGYESHSYKYDNGFTETKTWSQGCGSPTSPDKCANAMQTDGKLLSYISNAHTSINFTYIARQDVSDKLISEISLNKLGTPSVMAGKFILTYTTEEATNINHFTSIWSELKLQYTPYLTALKEESADAAFYRQHGFAYITPASRPHRLSYSQDHWGYYNGQNNNTLIPTPSDGLLATNVPTANAIRTAVESYAKMGLLQTITYPTGGTDVIEYGINKYYNSLTAAHEDVGGLRVSAVTSQNPGEAAQEKKFYYGQMSSLTQSSLNTVRMPVYIKNYMEKYEPVPGSGNYDYCEHVGLYGNSLNTLNTYQNSPVSYVYVVEGIGSNFQGGAIQSKFKAVEDIPGTTLLGNFLIGQPMTNASANYNGKLEEEIVYKNGGSGLFPIKKTANLYYTDTRVGGVVSGYAVNHSKQDILSSSCPVNNNVNNFDLIRYDVLSTWVYLQKTTETSYDEMGLNPATKVTDYFHDDDEFHLQVTRTETTDGQGNTVKTAFKYPHDYVSNPACSACSSMVSKTIFSPVINFKQTKTGSNTPIFEVLTNYTEFTPGNIAPSEIKKSTQSSGLNSEGTFDNYDLKGNLLQYTDKSGIVNTVIWGYNYLYPVAKIMGANYSAVVATLTGGNVTALQTMDGEALLTELNKIRTGLSAAFVTTYTYKHLAGVTSITDPNNKRTSYQYDSFNRLILVRDHNNKILKQVCYNYQGQVENCTVPCDPNPVWQNTATPLRCEIVSCAYTGYQQQEQEDINPCNTSGTKRWINVGYNPTACTGTFVTLTYTNTTSSPYTVDYTNTTTGITYSFTALASPTNGTLGCIPSGRYNVHAYSAGSLALTTFTVNSNTISGTEATFNSINMAFTANRNISIGL